jgi:hypothetical protein
MVALTWSTLDLTKNSNLTSWLAESIRIYARLGHTDLSEIRSIHSLKVPQRED